MPSNPMKTSTINKTFRPAQLALAATAALALASTAHAQILSNGTGGGDYNVGATWDGGTAPVSNDSFTVRSVDTVTATANIERRNGADSTVAGTLDLDNPAGTNYSLLFVGSGTNDLNVTGTITNVHNLNDANATDALVRMHIDGGSVTLGWGLVLYKGNAHEVTLSNGATLSASYTHIYGSDPNDRAQLTINGPGTWGIRDCQFASAVAAPDTATDFRFNFGTAAGVDALAVINTPNKLLLANNALTIDFTTINRSLNTGSFSTTLFDYSGNFTGSFGTTTFLGLKAGESASFIQDTVNTKFYVDYTLVPEPSTALLLIPGLGAMLLLRRRRR